MKKGVVLLVVMMMCLGLCSCGVNFSEGKNNEIVFTEGIVIVENDFARVELVNFYEEESYGEQLTSKYITLKVKNKSDRQFLFDLSDAYIGENAVVSMMCDGNSGPLPGKANTHTYIITKDDSNYTPIDSIEELYELEGVLEFTVLTEDGEYIEERVEEYFSLKNLNLK